MAKQSITCPRCEGKGVIPRYYYNKKGICFLCWGRKTVSVELNPGETPEQAYTRRQGEEAERLQQKPPSLPIPETFRNKAFQDIHEKAAYNKGTADKPADAMTTDQIDQAIGGLQMVVNMGGEDSVRQMAAAAGVKVDGDLLKSIRKHLENGGTMEAKKQPAKDGKVGRETMATTERGTAVKTRYKVLEASELIASHDLNGGHNPLFPKELQPRDRTRTASKLQVDQIAKELDFNRLGESALASSGSPIVAGDNVVESGNGRILGIKLAYEKGNTAAAGYKEALRQNAASFGIDPNEIQGMKNPVLVRERISDVDRLQFVKEANESGVSSMSAAEQGKVDADALTSFVVDQFEGGDLRAIKNRPFINAFMENIVSAADRNKFLTEKTDQDGMKVGELSRDGENRIKNAMFAKAYGDADLLAKKAELDDESNVKNVLQVLEDNSVRYAKMQAAIAAGTLHDHDLSKDLVSAVKKLDELRKTGESVSQYLDQPSFFGSELSEEARAILHYFEKNKRSKVNIDNFLNAYMDELEALGNPNELDMFAGFDDDLSTSNIDKMKLIETAVARHQAELVPEMKRVAANVDVPEEAAPAALPPEPEPTPEPAQTPEESKKETKQRARLLQYEVEEMAKEVKSLLWVNYQSQTIDGITESFDKVMEGDRVLVDLGSNADEFNRPGMVNNPNKQLDYVEKRYAALKSVLDRIKTAAPPAQSGNAAAQLPDPDESDKGQNILNGRVVGFNVKGEMARIIEETAVDKAFPGKSSFVYRMKNNGISYPIINRNQFQKDHYTMSFATAVPGGDDTSVDITFNKNGEITNATAHGKGHREYNEDLISSGIAAFKNVMDKVADRTGSERVEYVIAGKLAEKERREALLREKEAGAAERIAAAAEAARQAALEEEKSGLTDLVVNRRRALRELKTLARDAEMKYSNTDENGVIIKDEGVVIETLRTATTNKPKTKDVEELKKFEESLIADYEAALKRIKKIYDRKRRERPEDFE